MVRQQPSISPCSRLLPGKQHTQDRVVPSYSRLSAMPPPTGSCSRVTLPGRPSVRPRCWRATGPGHERPRSRSRRRTPGRRDWRTPAPATSQCGPLPSSVGNWVRMVRRVIIACGLRHHRSAFSQLEFSRQKSENAGKVNTTSTASVCTHFPHQKLLRFRPFWSIFVNTESTSM